MKKNWKIFVIHHSHTDIGYTERQDKIIRYHYDFIKQAIDTLNGIHRGTIKGAQGFKWQCENYWQVENFYSIADESYKNDFEAYVRSGEIGLSGNYLNMTELVDEHTLNSRLAKMEQYAQARDFTIESGMSADINGFAWGFADSLYDHGVKNFYSALHPHHGMFPLYKKVMPFYWKGPKGNAVLVWNGEHYHFGNELCLAPYAASSYMIYDEMHDAYRSNQLFNKDRQDTLDMELSILDKRLRGYVSNLEEEKYPYDFFPVLVSGAITDNGFPNHGMAERIQLLNTTYTDQFSFEMVTLDDFFSHVRRNCSDIPTYSGDWNDWWADGVGSTPLAVKECKEAQRKLSISRKLDSMDDEAIATSVEDAEQGIMMYCEHTWGYSSSVSEPWDSLVNNLDMKKTAYAVNANTNASRSLDAVLSKFGETSIRYQREQLFGVVNPHDFPFTYKVNLFCELWEYLEGVKFSEKLAFEVVDRKTGNVVPHQLRKIARAYQIEIVVPFEAKEKREFYLRRKEQDVYTIRNHAHIGAEGIQDIVQDDGASAVIGPVVTEHFIITFDEKIGISNIFDKVNQRSVVLENAPYAPFSGVYEVTNAKYGQVETRRRMGRNRKSIATKRSSSQLQDIRVTDNGPVFTQVTLDYSLDGTQFYSVNVKSYKEIPSIEVNVRIHKDSSWDPENLYVSLPFVLGAQQETFIDKTACIIRPGIDQLPGTNKEFYLIQNGIVHREGEKNLVIAIKDNPLITFGDLRAKPIELCSGNDVDFNKQAAYAWVMNNFWETNFKVDLAGFYEFTYGIMLTSSSDVQQAFKIAEAMNEGVVSFYQ